MDTSEPRLQCVEVVADLPVLWASLQRLDLCATLARLFPAPLHWKCPLGPGEVLSVWLLFLLSQGDHCLNHVLRGRLVELPGAGADEDGEETRLPGPAGAARGRGVLRDAGATRRGGDQ